MGNISDKIALRGLFDGAHRYEGVVYTGVYPKDNLERVKTFQFRPDDVLLVGYPKSGRIWLEEAVWLLQNDTDFDEANKINTRVRVMPVELKVPARAASMDVLAQVDGPRVMATYLYYHFYKTQLSKTRPKVIVMLRNPKDVLVSFYHHYRMCVGFGYYKGTWADFLKLANSKKLNLGDWADHVSGWWAPNKDKKNFLFVKYEDMVKDGRREVQRIAEFLGKAYSDHVINKIADHCSYEKMVENPRCNMQDMPAYDQRISKFLRKGTVGDWRNYFTHDQNKIINARYRKIKAKSGLEMSFLLYAETDAETDAEDTEPVENDIESVNGDL